MTPDSGRLGWTGKRLRAAMLVAAGELTGDQVAAEIGVAPKTIDRWKAEESFSTKVRELASELERKLIREGVANRQNRVAALDERWRRMQMVIDARAIDHAAVPGGNTGLLVRQVKLVKVYSAAGDEDDNVEDQVDELLEPQAHGGALLRKLARASLESAKRFVEVDEYKVDTGLLHELRAHEEQAARELGQWEDKRTVTLTVEKELEGALDRLQAQLSREEYARVLAALATGEAGPGAA